MPPFKYMGDMMMVSQCEQYDDNCAEYGCPGEISHECVFLIGAGTAEDIDEEFRHLFLDMQYPLLPIIKPDGWV
jgi:hypothetical protein